MHTITTTTTRMFVALQAARQRLAHDERGEITSAVVYKAGMVIAAIAVLAIIYTKLTGAANDIDVSPGVG